MSFPVARIDADDILLELEHLRKENAELRQRLMLPSVKPKPSVTVESLELPLIDQPLTAVTNASTLGAKIALFRSVFKSREDVYAVAWINERTGKKGYSPACKDPWSLRKGQPREYLPLTDQVIQDHLAGS